MTDHLLQVGGIAAAILAIGGLAAGVYKFSIWIKSLNDSVVRVSKLVHHELRPNSGSSMKDQQRDQLQALDEIQVQMRENREQDRQWQDGVMLTLGNHEGRIDNLEKK